MPSKIFFTESIISVQKQASVWERKIIIFREYCFIRSKQLPFVYQYVSIPNGNNLSLHFFQRYIYEVGSVKDRIVIVYMNKPKITTSRDHLSNFASVPFASLYDNDFSRSRLQEIQNAK